MADRQTQFLWFVCEEPYEVLDIGGTRMLAERMNTPRRPYSPLADNTGLYLRFAETAPTESGILSFASRYGLLGIAQPNTVKREPEFWVERLEVWRREIRLMRIAEKLRRAWQSGQFGDVASLFQHWNGETELRVPARKSPFESLGDLRIRIGPTSTRNPASALNDVALAIQQIANQQLEGNVSAGLGWNAQLTKATLHRIPSNLLAALWLQFARAVEGNKEHSQCEECQTWFEVGPGEGFRRDARFCGNACRARAWRKSKGESK